MKTMGLIGLLAITLFPLAAQEAPRDEAAPIDELLSTPVSTAAKYDQRMSDIPAAPPDSLNRRVTMHVHRLRMS